MQAKAATGRAPIRPWTTLLRQLFIPAPSLLCCRCTFRSSIFAAWESKQSTHTGRLVFQLPPSLCRLALLCVDDTHLCAPAQSLPPAAEQYACQCNLTLSASWACQRLTPPKHLQATNLQPLMQCMQVCAPLIAESVANSELSTSRRPAYRMCQTHLHHLGRCA